jgi:osmoprotectant transport system substrate-binding protein
MIMHRNKLTTLIVAFLLMASLVTYTECFAAPNTIIRVGSKNFTESLVLGEIYALALEDNGYKVERKLDIASSVVHTALVNKEIDLYPEYTGTGLLAILKHPLVTDPQKVYAIVKSEYLKKFNIVWLNYAAANDSQGLVIKRSIANKLGIKTLSDLQKNAHQIRFASQGEFDIREDGLPALEKAYGKFAFKSKAVFDNSLKYDVLANDKADLAVAYTTEGNLVDKKLLVLVDDKHVWPPYNIAPIIRNEVLAKNPKLAAIINKVTATIDNEKIIKLNAEIDVNKREYTDVAKEYYDSIKKEIKK